MSGDVKSIVDLTPRAMLLTGERFRIFSCSFVTFVDIAFSGFVLLVDCAC